MILSVFHLKSQTEQVLEAVEIQIKYEGFIQRQNQVVAKQKKLENMLKL